MASPGASASVMTAEGAKELIERIAAGRGTASPSIRERASHDPEFAHLLEICREMKDLAICTIEKLKDLNSSEAHFVLECIQNADDNEYPPDVEPFLRLSIADDRIQLDCNEIGFQADHVKAICSVDKSTKRARVGYIGEKGIGFKSVFKIAQEVHIYSPPFSFKFDKSRELGMITPEWITEGYAMHTLREDFQTAILLLPPTGETFTRRLFDDFKNITPTLLLFLRKIKSLELCVSEPTPVRKVLTYTTLNHGTWQFTKLRVEDNISQPQVREYDYYIVPQSNPISVIEERRVGITETELALAFPVEGAGQPREENQAIHAFLPIRDYGFKFLIQADFLLTSNRQDVDEAMVWNSAIRNMIPQLFRTAVMRFLGSSNAAFRTIRYTWMRYLPQGITQMYWKYIEQETLALMKNEPDLYSRDGTLHVPSSLEHLRDIALDEFGEPLVGNPSDYLSTSYHRRDYALLALLGVQAFSTNHFLRQLYYLADEEIKSKSQSWHESLAKCMVVFRQTGAWEEFPWFKNKTLIPLQDGTWTYPSVLESDPVFFRESAGLISVPADISLRLVASDASANPDRNNFFRLLGVKDCNEQDVADRILQKHQPNTVPLIEDAIIHAKYLFALPLAIKNNLNMRQFWLYDTRGWPGIGTDLYVENRTARYGPARLFQNSNLSIRYVSSDYVLHHTDRTSGEPFIQWLMRSTGLTDVPRIRRGAQISPEFSYLLANFPDEVLNILNHFWNVYKEEINSSNAIRAVISNHWVKCSAGLNVVRMSLNNSYIPTPLLRQAALELCNNGQALPFLVLEPETLTAWNFLSTFGVGVAADLNFYLWAGKQYQFRDSCTTPIAKKYLKKIAELTGFDMMKASVVFQEFSRTNLIFVSTVDGDLWVSHNNCVMTAPNGYRTKYILGPTYGSDHSVVNLLTRTLIIGDATVEDVIQDLSSQTPSDTYLGAVYEYIARKLTESASATSTATVRNLFARNDLIILPLADATRRVDSTACVWGGPPLSHKFDLQPHYGNNPHVKSLFCSILEIGAPTWDDVIQGLRDLVASDGTTGREVEPFYTYMFTAYARARPGIIRDFFETTPLIYTRDSAGANQWRRPSECVWSGPSFLRSKTPISNNHNLMDPEAISFLRQTLKIEDASLMDYIEDLRILQSGGRADHTEVETLYRRVETSLEGQQGALREIFQAEPLIYDYSRDRPRWVTLRVCVWAGPDCIQRTTKISRCYRSLQSLFCTHLGVRNATADNVTAELLAVADTIRQDSGSDHLPQNSLRRITELLVAIKDSELSPDSIRSLRSCKVWPCRPDKDSPLELVDSRTPFFVPDHKHYLDVLDHRVPVLAITGEGTGKLKALLVRLGLGSRYLSTSITVTPSATDTSLEDLALSRDLSRRASALFSCTERFKLPRSRWSRTPGLLLLLQGIRVFRTSEIHDIIDLNSQGFVRSAIIPGLLRMGEEENQLRIFVPRDDNSQRFAFTMDLPKKMFEFLDIPETECWSIISTILMVPLEMVDSVLVRNGILHYGREGVPNERGIYPASNSGADTVGEAQYERELPTSPPRTANGNVREPSAGLFGASPRSTSSIQNDLFRQANEQPSIDQSPRTPVPRVAVSNMQLGAVPTAQEIPPAPTEENQYEQRSDTEIGHSLSNLAARQELLRAQAMSADPTGFNIVLGRGERHADAGIGASSARSNFDLSSLVSALPTPNALMTLLLRSPAPRTHQQGGMVSPSMATRSPRSGSNFAAARTRAQGMRDIEIGFQGELYIVEVLKQHLSNTFNPLTHWTSKLRKYAGLPDYPHAEITDLTFPDTSGHLSRLLFSWSRNGSPPRWLQIAADDHVGPRPTYWMEVKTTTGACENPFFVSSHQYELMERMTLSGDEANVPENVYVLLRVHNIESLPQVRAYLDPWARRQEGHLEFTSSQWVVRTR